MIHFVGTFRFVRAIMALGLSINRRAGQRCFGQLDRVRVRLMRTNSPKLCCPALQLRFYWLRSYSSDGRVVRASASGAVDLGLIPSRVKPMTLKLVFTASLLDAQH